MQYDASKWYWIVAGDTSRVWSSAAAAYVPSTDAGFVAWREAGGVPTKIDTEANLRDVLANAYPAGWPGGESIGLLAAGCTITSPTRTYLDQTYALDSTHITYNTAIAAYMARNANRLPGGGNTIVIATTDGAGVVVQQADVNDVLSTLADFVAEVETAGRLKGMGQEASYPVQPVMID